MLGGFSPEELTAIRLSLRVGFWAMTFFGLVSTARADPASPASRLRSAPGAARRIAPLARFRERLGPQDRPRAETRS